MITHSNPAVAAPPSKSLSHRKLITASLAKGVSALSNVLESADTERTMSILSLAGAKIVRKGKGEFEITGTGGKLRGGEKTPLSCYLHESGTSARLLAAVLSAGSGEFFLHGAPRLHARPMGELFAVLRGLGVSVTFDEKQDHLPATLRTNGLLQADDGMFIPVPCDVSSQFLSGLLLAAPLANHPENHPAANGLRLLLAGKKTVSWPYVGLTLQAMEEAGCPVMVETFVNGTWEKTDWRLIKTAIPGETRFSLASGASPGEPDGYRALTGRNGVVEGDYSGASYLLAAGAIGPSPVTVTGLSPSSLQGDMAVLDILRAMGAKVSWEAKVSWSSKASWGTKASWYENAVTVTPGKLTGITRDMGDCPDLVPTVAVLAALAEGETVITGIAHLTAKESDRLAAPATELAKIGCVMDVSPDSLRIRPAPTAKNGNLLNFSAHNDHRMAMSLALLERAGFGVALDDPTCVAKSFPEFWNVWATIHPGTNIRSAGEPVGNAEET